MNTPLSTDPQQQLGKPDGGWRARLYAIIFESDTPKGRAFDLALIGAILLSVLVVVLASVRPLAQRHGLWLEGAEWFFTVLFTVEYVARCLCVKRPLVYARSFFGVIDLMSILPSFVALFFPAAHVVLGVRILRLLRIFRILKLTLYIEEYGMLGEALLASRRKIFIFLSVVFLIVFLLGTVMYVVEGPENGYTSIPTAVYWAISTMTTVGFGDLVPKTDIGRSIASCMMLLGWGILAVPTGIISSELSYQRGRITLGPRACPACQSHGHEHSASYCKDCGAALGPETSSTRPGGSAQQSE
jgi:voltage-gated potassium channel